MTLVARMSVTAAVLGAVLSVVVAVDGSGAVRRPAGCGKPVAAPRGSELVPHAPSAFLMCLATAREKTDRGGSAAVAKRLAGELDLLPPQTGEAIPVRCEAVSPPTVVVGFTYSDRPGAQVLVQLGGCHLVSNGRVTRTASGKWAFVARDLGSYIDPRPAEHPRPVHIAGAPECSTRTDLAPDLTGASETAVPLSGDPFGVVADRKDSFVSVTATNGRAHVDVFSTTGAQPQLVHTITLPGRIAAGEALTPDGNDLLVVTATNVAVLSTSRAVTGQPGAILGTLSSPDRLLLGPIEVVVDPTGQYAFVSEEDSADIAVYDLRTSLRDHFTRSSLIGTIPAGGAPVGMAFARDGRWLYATSVLATGRQGSLSVINVARAEHTPQSAVAVNLTAGCQPVRVAVAPNGRTVWVTARASNTVEAFSSPRLRVDPGSALIGKARVGQSPVGLTFINNGQELIVGDSDRFETPGAQSGLSVLDTIHPENPTVLGDLPAGSFPRDMTLAPDGTLLVPDFLGGELQAFDAASLKSP